MLQKSYYVYMLASKKYGTLYIGVTSQLLNRIYQHKQNVAPRFTSKYKVHQLIYFEEHVEIHEALLREKQLKKWHRDWKINLIEQNNPEWLDLYYELI